MQLPGAFFFFTLLLGLFLGAKSREKKYFCFSLQLKIWLDVMFGPFKG